MFRFVADNIIMSQEHFQTHSTAGDDFYKMIAPVYEPVVGPFLRPVRLAIVRLASDQACRRMLDIACGTGKQAKMLAKAGHTVTGIDLSPSMLERATRGSSGTDNILFIFGNGENLPFSAGSFDCAIISLALHEMNYPVAVGVMREALKTLAPGGKLFLFDYLRTGRFISGFSLALLHIVERFAGRRHYRNFRHFVRHGGLESFMEQFDAELISRREFFGAAAGLLVYRK